MVFNNPSFYVFIFFSIFLKNIHNKRNMIVKFCNKFVVAIFEKMYYNILCKSVTSGTYKINKTYEVIKKMSASRAKKSHKPHKSHGGLKRAFLIFILILCMATVIAIGVVIGMYASAVREIHAMNVQNLAINYSSVVYYTDETGNAREMEEVYNNGNRIWLDSDEIPDVMKDAIVAIEDERFYDHNGVDLKRTAGAFFGWVRAKLTHGTTSYGGSTITQQVIKNITQDKDKTAARKIKEMLLSVALEKELTKDEILTIYLNLICLANNCYGVEAASNIYYDIDAIDLNLNQAATLAGITQRPEYYNPIKNPDNAKYKRDVVLTKMCELGMISQEERDETIAKGLQLSSKNTEVKKRIFSYFTDNLLNEIIADLQEEKGYSKDMAEQVVYSGGLSIYSTVDTSIQDKLESVYENKTGFPNIKAQSAMIIMDPYTGEIKAMVGGVGKKTESRGLNRATQARRQPGSSIKPLAVYAPAIEEDEINEASTILDGPITIGDWSPKNSYSGYKGKISVKRAVQISANTTAVRVLQSLGVSKSFNYATEKFGLKLRDTDKNLSSLGLGGLTKGVTPKEMAAAYCVFANGGVYIEPHSYTKVVDHAGNVLLEKESGGKRVISDSTAFIMTDILKAVVNTSAGTGKAAKLSEMPTYGKTGTTNNNYDKWFVGYTPYYVGAVWYGFDEQESLSKYGVSSSVSAKIWKTVMERVHEGLEIKDFKAPDSVEKKGNDYFAVDSKLKKSSSNVESSDNISTKKSTKTKKKTSESTNETTSTEHSGTSHNQHSSGTQNNQSDKPKTDTPENTGGTTGSGSSTSGSQSSSDNNQSTSGSGTGVNNSSGSGNSSALPPIERPSSQDPIVIE